MTAATTAPTSSWRSCSAIGIPGTTTRSSLDKQTGLFAHPDKVRRLDYAGRVLPLARPVHRAALGAGPSGDHPGRASGRGRVSPRAGPSWCSSATITWRSGKAGLRRLQGTGRRHWPRPGQGVRRRRHLLRRRRDPRRGRGQGRADRQAAEGDRPALRCLSEVLNFDFSKKPVDEPFTEEEIDRLDRRAGHARPRVPPDSASATPRRATSSTSPSAARSTTIRVSSAAPKDVADGMEEWFTGRACDGFVVAASHVPGTYEDFARYVDTRIATPGLASQRLSRHHVAREPWAWTGRRSATGARLD